MSRRPLRVASLIRSIVADAIQTRLSDPRIEPMTSVTRVEVSGDLSTARVYVSVMADERRRRRCLAALERAAGRVRGMVARQISLRKAPQISFHLDESVRGSFATVELIERVMSEHEPAAEPRGTDGATTKGVAPDGPSGKEDT